MPSLRRLFVAAVSCTLVACAAPVKRTSADDQSIRSVAVVSLLNEKTTVDRIGLTVFNNKSVLIDQSGVLNNVAIAAVEGSLRAARPAWEMKDARREVAALVERKNAAGTSWTSAVSSISGELASLANRLNVDAMFVVVDHNLENMPGRGVGARLRTLSVNSVRDITVHAVTLVVLVDRSGKEVTNRWATPFQTLPAAELGIDYEMSVLATPEGQQRLRSLMQQRLQTSLTAATAAMGY
jgi:hypothetical protein